MRGRMQAAVGAGVERERLIADPGFGFGKRGEENWALLGGFARLRALRLPLLAGLSRKGFLSAANHEAAAERDDLTHAADTIAIVSGAHVVRVHDVRGAVRCATVADSVLRLTPR